MAIRPGTVARPIDRPRNGGNAAAKEPSDPVQAGIARWVQQSVVGESPAYEATTIPSVRATPFRFDAEAWQADMMKRIGDLAGEDASARAAAGRSAALDFSKQMGAAQEAAASNATVRGVAGSGAEGALAAYGQGEAASVYAQRLAEIEKASADRGIQGATLAMQGAQTLLAAQGLELQEQESRFNAWQSAYSTLVNADELNDKDSQYAFGQLSAMLLSGQMTLEEFAARVGISQAD